MSATLSISKVRPISVLVVMGRYPPMHTGAGLRLHRTYKRICAANSVHVSVLTTQRSQEQPLHEQFEGVEVYRIRDSRSMLVQLVRCGREFLRRRFGRLDMVHAVGESAFVVVACIWAKMLSRRLVREKSILDNGEPVTAWSWLRRVLNYPWFHYWLNCSFRRADLLIAMNAQMASYYQQLHVDPSRIWTRPNPVDTTQYTSAN